MGLRRIDKREIQKLAKACGATVVNTFANSEGGESFNESYLGSADCVYEENLGDVDYIFVKNPKGSSKKICSLVL